MISCPNLSNKVVAQQFQELVDAVGEVAAYDIWSQNEGNAIDRAPNGAPSKLFSDLLEHFNGNRVLAIQAKAKVFSKGFKTWFGDWLSTENDIKPGEIIFGHPAIGKTYSFEQGKYKDKFIDWDVEYNQKRDKWIEDHSNTKLGTPEYKKARNEYLIYPENHPDYVEFITSEWERVKAKAKNEGKILFASPHTLLKFFPQDFTRIINLEKNDFIKRNTDRGGKNKEGAMWKEGIDETIANTKNIPITTLSEGEYFEDYLNKVFNKVSKVVDENGEPKIMFRTDNQGKTIMREQGGRSFFATDNLGVAGSYATEESSLYKGFINLKNPYIVTGESHGYFFNYKGKETDAINAKEELIHDGYDGVLFERTWDVGDNAEFDENDDFWAMNVAMFDPNQIKSATENIGTFDPVNNDIRFQKLDETVVTAKPGKLQKDTLANPELKATTDRIIALAEKLSRRIGISFNVINDKNEMYRGKYETSSSGSEFVTLNLYYASLDTPIHEIFGHPIIDAIRKGNEKLYANLIKDLNYGKGKEILSRVVEQYPELTLEQAKDEALVTLLGELAANKLNSINEVGLAYRLRELLRKMNELILRLLKKDSTNKEHLNKLAAIRLEKLSSTIRLRDIVNMVTDSESKVVRPGYKLEHTTPDGITFDTYGEAMKHLNRLSEESVNIDINEVDINLNDEEYEELRQKLENNVVEAERAYEENIHSYESQLKILEEEYKKSMERLTFQEPYVKEFFNDDLNKKYLDILKDAEIDIDKYMYIRIQNTESPIRKGDFKAELPKGYSGYYLFLYSDKSTIKDVVLPISEEFATDIWKYEGSEGDPNLYSRIGNLRWIIGNLQTDLDYAKNKLKEFYGLTPEELEEAKVKIHEKVEDYLKILEAQRKEFNELNEKLKSFSDEEKADAIDPNGDEKNPVRDIIYDIERNKSTAYSIVSNLLNAVKNYLISTNSIEKYGLRLSSFLNKNAQYELVSKILDNWKKSNNIEYNPNEAYAMGYGFYSSIGAYADLNLDLLLQNIINNVEDNKKVGGNFTVSAYTKKVDTKLDDLERNSYVRFVIYPKSEDIDWAASGDVYSGSVFDSYALFVDESAKETAGVSYTKTPSPQGLHHVAHSIEDAILNTDGYNELGINLTFNNFRLEYDTLASPSIKEQIDKINSYLDKTYGKIEKPNINRAVDTEKAHIQRKVKSYKSLRAPVYNIIDETLLSENIDILNKANINKKLTALKNASKKYPEITIMSKIIKEGMYDDDLYEGSFFSKLGLQTKESTETRVRYSKVSNNSSNTVIQPGTAQTNAAHASAAAVKPKLDALQTVYSKIITGLKQRIDSISRYTTTNVATLSATEKLVKDLEKGKLITELTEAEEQLGIIQFIEFVDEDLLGKPIEYGGVKYTSTLDYIEAAMKNPDLINVRQLNQLNTDYIGFYKPLFSEIKRLMDTTSFFDNLPNKADISAHVDKLINAFTSVGNKYDLLVEIHSKRVVKAWGEATGSTTLSDTIERLTSTDSDILAIAKYMGMSSQVDDEIIRLVHVSIENAKNEVARRTNVKGRELLDLYDKVANKSDILLLQELDKNGRRTGYIVRDLLYGQMYADNLAKRAELNSKYGIESDKEFHTLSEDDRRAYNKEWNEHLAEYAERKFVKEYYDAASLLSDDAKKARDEIQLDINLIIGKVTDKNGNKNLHKLPLAERNKLRHLYKLKANLGNEYNLADGSHKTGLDLKIALEIQAFNKALDTNLKYKINDAAYKAARATALANLTPDEMLVWDSMNTKRTYTQEFWDKLAAMERAQYGLEYDALSKQRSKLLSLVRSNDKPASDTKLFNNKLLLAIKDIDLRMKAIREQAPKQAINGPKFSDIAEIITDVEWKEGLRDALNTNDAAWLNVNTILNSDGSYSAVSAWTYIQPKESKYIINEPNRMWSEVSDESAWLNPNFNKSPDAEYIQPKRSKYDNTAAYKKAMAVPGLKALHDKLLDTADESNAKVTFLVNSNRFKLPQITARTFQILGRQANVIESAKYLINDTTGIKDDDAEFTDGFDKRPDGSYIKFVPTHYLHKLTDTNMITDDVVGSYILYFEMAENWKQMNAIAPEIELVAHQVSKRTVTRKVGVSGKTETVEGTLSNTYAKLINLIDMQVYGKRKERTEVKLPGTEKKISLTKILNNFAEYVRKTNLFMNLPAILTNILTAGAYSSIEGILGRYYSAGALNDANKELVQRLPDAMANLGNPNHKCLLTAFLDLNQVSRSNADTYSKLDQSRALRAINKHFWYGGYSAGDFAVKSTMLVAIYKDHKLYNGEFINRQQFISRYYSSNKSEGNRIWSTMGDTLFDAYELKGSLAVPKKEYAQYIDKRLENKIKNLATFLAARLDGVLTDGDRAYVHQNAYLQMLFIHRNFFIIGAHDRFKSRQFNHMTQMEEEGMYRTTAKFVIDIFKSGNVFNIKAIADMYQGAEEFEQYNIKRTILETLYINIIAFAILPLLNQAADDEPDNWFLNEMAYVALRTRFELSTMYNPMEVINMLNSPSAATGTIEQMSGIIKVVWPGNWFGDGSAFSEVRSGPYEGMPRIMKQLIKSGPVKNIFEVRDPRTKRKYMETQLTF